MKADQKSLAGGQDQYIEKRKKLKTWELEVFRFLLTVMKKGSSTVDE